MNTQAVWVHISTTQEVVKVGLRTILQGAEAPFEVCLDRVSDAEPDVVLFDVIQMSSGDTTDLDRWVTDTDTTVIAIDRTLRPELGARAREHGVEWSIDLGISAAQLVQVIEEAIAGDLDDSEIATEWDPTAHLGAAMGLSARESQVLGLVAAGRSNHEVAEQLYLSINSIKTYVRSAYRKIGVTTRSQAVLWAVQNGFPVPQPGRWDDDGTATTGRLPQGQVGQD